MRAVWRCFSAFRIMIPDRHQDPGCGDSFILAIIGGGAAGLLAAVAAGRLIRPFHESGETPDTPAISVMLFEGQDRIGRKILATGNGRCNLSNRNCSVQDYHGRDVRFALGALHRLPVADTLALFRQMGLLCREESDGRIFPYSYQASAVLDILRWEADRLGVSVLTGCKVTTLDIRTDQPRGRTGFLLRTADGRQWPADRVIVATGGLAAPAFGCDGSGYRLMTRLGHQLVDPFPALVQINTETGVVRGLSGIKFEGLAAVRFGGSRLQSAAGEILFTEYGLSGPPILLLARRIAELSAEPEPVWIDLNVLPDLTADELSRWLAEKRQANSALPLADFLTGLVHKKIGQAIIRQAVGRPQSQPAGDLTAGDLHQIATLLQSWPFRALSPRDWSQAQVTAGGLAVADFRPDTLESRRIPGLFAAGEILDIDGDCGGYNLQWAWSSGYLAGRRAAEQLIALRTEAGGVCPPAV